MKLSSDHRKAHHDSPFAEAKKKAKLSEFASIKRQRDRFVHRPTVLFFVVQSHFCRSGSDSVGTDDGWSCGRESCDTLKARPEEWVCPRRVKSPCLAPYVRTREGFSLSRPSTWDRLRGNLLRDAFGPSPCLINLIWLFLARGSFIIVRILVLSEFLIPRVHDYFLC